MKSPRDSPSSSVARRCSVVSARLDGLARVAAEEDGDDVDVEAVEEAVAAEVEGEDEAAEVAMARDQQARGSFGVGRTWSQPGEPTRRPALAPIGGFSNGRD